MQRRSALKKLFAGIVGLFTGSAVIGSTAVNNRFKMKEVNGRKIYYAELPAKEALDMLTGLAEQVYSRKLNWYSCTFNGDTANISCGMQPRRQIGWHVIVTYKWKSTGEINTYKQVCESEEQANSVLEAPVSKHWTSSHYQVIGTTKYRIYEE